MTAPETAPAPPPPPPATGLARYVPMLDWGRRYDRAALTNDLVAAVIVTIMLIPQSLAYALLAGLPAEVGLYASIAPLIAYAVFGTSRALAVGPVAVVSLMTAAAIAQLDLADPAQKVAAAAALALISGAMLVAMGVLRLGFLANLLSHPVIAGFITASGIIIAASQLKHILGVPAHGHNLYELVLSLWAHLPETNWATVAIGGSATLFLFWVRKGLKPLLIKLGLRPRLADVVAKAGPVVAVVATTTAAWGFDLAGQGVAVVGAVPAALPPLAAPAFDADLWLALHRSAALISIIGFVESVSVAQTLAAKKRQRIVPNQELIGLGTANIAAATTGGYPVTGGFARSVVNFDAGAETPAAGAFTAIGICIAAVALTPLLFFLPKAALAATIIVAVLSLVDFSILRRAWDHDIADFIAVAATIVTTLGMGVEAGVSAGVALSLALHIYRTSRPHVAVVGLVPGTQHFRNVNRHEVRTTPGVLSIRVDESLYFANARFLEDYVYDHIAADPTIKHVVLMGSAINQIDLSALESLEAINQRLKDVGVTLHLSEIKGPVMDGLKRGHFLKDLTGKVFLSQYEAIRALESER